MPQRFVISEEPSHASTAEQRYNSLLFDRHDTMLVAASDSVTARPNSIDVQRVPVTFHGCFGWLHYRPDLAAMDAGVVICPSLNRDALNAHFMLGLLADDMAAAGYKVLRFDYPSTGDSLDLADCGDSPAGQWRGWQVSIEAAADWMRDHAGVNRIILCGLRIGALLAATVAAQRPDVAGLALLAPVTRGQSYMRQLWVEAQLQQGEQPPLIEGLQFQDQLFSAETVAEISNVDLRKLEFAKGIPIGLFAQAQSKLLQECLLNWARQGLEVFCGSYAGLEPLLQHNLEESSVLFDTRNITEWLVSCVKPQLTAIALPTFVPEAVILQSRLYIETPICFGIDKRLFGVLCQPASCAADMVVVIGNTGRDPHHGMARYGVEFARRLAVEGFASFRMDFAGLGDSIGTAKDARQLSPMFDQDRTPDVAAALDMLENRGFRHFAAHGLCAGAYHMFYAAVGDHRIKTVLLVNIPLFTWQQGDDAQFVRFKTLPFRYFLGVAFSKEFWPKFASGQLKPMSVVRAKMQRLRDAWTRSNGRLVHYLRRTKPANLSAGPHNLQKLSARGARSLFLFAPDEDGLHAIEQEFGPRGISSKVFPGTATQILPELNHLLSTAQMRAAASAAMIRFLRGANVI